MAARTLQAQSLLSGPCASCLQAGDGMAAAQALATLIQDAQHQVALQSVALAESGGSPKKAAALRKAKALHSATETGCPSGELQCLPRQGIISNIILPRLYDVLTEREHTSSSLLFLTSSEKCEQCWVTGMYRLSKQLVTESTLMYAQRTRSNAGCLRWLRRSTSTPKLPSAMHGAPSRVP